MLCMQQSFRLIALSIRSTCVNFSVLFFQAFADAYSFFEKTLVEFSKGINNREGLKLLPSILSSSDSLELIVE